AAESPLTRGDLARPLPLVVDAHGRQLELRLGRVELGEEVVEAGKRSTACRDEQVAALEPGSLGGASLLNALDEQAVALGEADGAAHPACRVGGREGEAERDPSRALAASEPLDPIP